jgi:DNA-binding FadR family transcriptional regulator
MGAVEGTAASLAATRRSASQLDELSEINTRLSQLGKDVREGGDQQAYRLLNREFHSAIHRMAGTEIVEQFGSSLYDRADFFLYGGSRGSAFPEAAGALQQGHALMESAIRDQDAAAAFQSARDHSMAVIDFIPEPHDLAPMVKSARR